MGMRRDTSGVAGGVFLLGDDDNPLSFSGSVTTGWDGTAVSASGYEEIQLDVTAINGATITVKGGVSTAGNTLTGVNMGTNATLTSITANGLYSFPACAKVAYTAAGGTPTVNLLRI